MTSIFDKDSIRKNCDEFFGLYDVTKEGILEMCERKRIHTQKVAENSINIAKSMGLDEYDCGLAWTIGELHDFARFGQAVVTHTFKDSDRFNHARLGARILFTHRMIDDIMTNYDDLSEEDKLVMYKAVYYHGDYALPDDLTEREKLFCEIIRDADKTDIFRTSAESRWESSCGYSKDEIIHSDISPAIEAVFYKHETAKNKDRALPADYHLAHIALCFGLVSEAARQQVVRQGYIRRLMDIEFVRPNVQSRYAKMMEQVNNFMGM